MSVFPRRRKARGHRASPNSPTVSVIRPMGTWSALGDGLAWTAGEHGRFPIAGPGGRGGASTRRGRHLRGGGGGGRVRGGPPGRGGGPPPPPRKPRRGGGGQEKAVRARARTRPGP